MPEQQTYGKTRRLLKVFGVRIRFLSFYPTTFLRDVNHAITIDLNDGSSRFRFMSTIRLMIIGTAAAFPVLAAVPIASIGAELQVRAIPDAIAGAYSNGAQVEALPDGVSQAPALRGSWIDSQYAVFAQVTVPAVDGQALYLQWHEDGPDGPISRQRIWTFAEGGEPGTVEMRFFTIADGKLEVVRDAHLDPDRAANLEESDLIAYPAGCEVIWRSTDDGYKGRIEDDCNIVAQRSGRSMKIEAEITVSKDSVTYREAGVLEDGSYAFLVPGTDTYVFERID